MNPTPTQRVALVTGGAVRVGRAIALALADHGFDIAFTFRSSGDEAVQTAADVEALGRVALAVRADLTEPESVDSVLTAVRERFGRLDVLVNSAASFEVRTLAEVDAAAWDRVMALNARAPHLLVRAAAPLLRQARGSVVNIVDLSAIQPWTDYAAHSVSKAALAHLTRLQARALAPEVRVNAVAPGAVLKPDDWPAERWEELAEAAPLRRTGSPRDVADAVLYFVRAGFVTGQILAVDGGRLLGPPE